MELHWLPIRPYEHEKLIGHLQIHQPYAVPKRIENGVKGQTSLDPGRYPFFMLSLVGQYHIHHLK